MTANHEKSDGEVAYEAWTSSDEPSWLELTDGEREVWERAAPGLPFPTTPQGEP